MVLSFFIGLCGKSPGRFSYVYGDVYKRQIVNNPCNPTGAAYDMQTYQTLAQVAEEFDLVVILDEIYTDYMFDVPFRPFRGLPGMAQRSITLNSFSKNYIMTGWRVGSIIAEPAVIDTIKRCV